LIAFLTITDVPENQAKLEDTPPKETYQTSSPLSLSENSPDSPRLAPDASDVSAKSSTADTSPESSNDQKNQILLGIDDSISTYSEEGVDQITPLLASPDPEIREAAIEGMKQLSLPKAAAVLREVAAKGTTSPADRAAMLEAADFIDLPEYQPRRKKSSP
jgi:hypothetical protein